MDWDKAKKTVDKAARNEDGSWDFARGIKNLAGAVDGFLQSNTRREATDLQAPDQDIQEQTPHINMGQKKGRRRPLKKKDKKEEL